MLKIKYDVFLAENTETGAFQVAPIINSPYYALKGAFNWPYLSVPNHDEVCWQWWLSEISLKNEQEQLQEIQVWTQPNVMTIRPVLKNGILKDKIFYSQYLKSVFTPLHCGVARDEMLTKLYGKFVGADWADDIMGFLRNPLQSEKPLLTCKIRVAYGTFQPLLPPYDIERKRKIDVTIWKPKDSMDYSIVWHLFVTISNGETYKMYFPICSLNRWQSTIERYFETNPQAILSPNGIIGVTNHSEGYSYKSIMDDLKYCEENTMGSSVSEILLKLSIWRAFPEQEEHLKTVLTGNHVELTFSGNVICEEPT